MFRKLKLKVLLYCNVILKLDIKSFGYLPAKLHTSIYRTTSENMKNIFFVCLFCLKLKQLGKYNWSIPVIKSVFWQFRKQVYVRQVSAPCVSNFHLMQCELAVVHNTLFPYLSNQL